MAPQPITPPHSERADYLESQAEHQLRASLDRAHVRLTEQHAELQTVRGAVARMGGQVDEILELQRLIAAKLGIEAPRRNVQATVPG